MKANQVNFSVPALCTALRVLHSGCDDWLERALSARAQANAALMQRISEMRHASRATYSMPRIDAELAEKWAWWPSAIALPV